VFKGISAVLLLLLFSWMALVAFLLFSAALVSLYLGPFQGVIKFFITLLVGLGLIYGWYVLLKALFKLFSRPASPLRSQL